MSQYGKVLPQFYDLLMGKEPFILTPLKKLLNLYSPNPKKILEVACGTGSILKSFPNITELHGLDLSKDMLKIARKKVPYATFHHGNMTNFSLRGKFDLIFCVYDSINHLNNFSDWDKTFTTVEKHLDEKGVFIFDMNTFYRLKEALIAEPYVKKIKNMIVCRRVFPTKDPHMFDIFFQIFSDINKKLISYQEEHIFESAFEVDAVKKLLEKHFVVKRVYDYKKERLSKKSLRVFFVCLPK